MKKTIISTWVCPLCGSDNVEMKAWINPNTNSVSYPDETEDCWCCDCETHNVLGTEDIPVANKIIGFQVFHKETQDLHPDIESLWAVYNLAQAQQMLQDAGYELKVVRKNVLQNYVMKYEGKNPRN